MSIPAPPPPPPPPAPLPSANQEIAQQREANQIATDMSKELAAIKSKSSNRLPSSNVEKRADNRLPGGEEEGAQAQNRLPANNRLPDNNRLPANNRLPGLAGDSNRLPAHPKQAVVEEEKELAKALKKEEVKEEVKELEQNAGSEDEEGESSGGEDKTGGSEAQSGEKCDCVALETCIESKKGDACLKATPGCTSSLEHCCVEPSAGKEIASCLADAESAEMCLSRHRCDKAAREAKGGAIASK